MTLLEFQCRDCDISTMLAQTESHTKCCSLVRGWCLGLKNSDVPQNEKHSSLVTMVAWLEADCIGCQSATGASGSNYTEVPPKTPLSSASLAKVCDLCCTSLLDVCPCIYKLGKLPVLKQGHVYTQDDCTAISEVSNLALRFYLSLTSVTKVVGKQITNPSLLLAAEHADMSDVWVTSDTHSNSQHLIQVLMSLITN